MLAVSVASQRKDSILLPVGTSNARSPSDRRRNAAAVRVSGPVIERLTRIVPKRTAHADPGRPLGQRPQGAAPRCGLIRCRHALQRRVHELADLRAGARGARDRAPGVRDRLLGQREALRGIGAVVGTLAAAPRPPGGVDRQAALPLGAGPGRIRRGARSDAIAGIHFGKVEIPDDPMNDPTIDWGSVVREGHNLPEEETDTEEETEDADSDA